MLTKILFVGSLSLLLTGMAGCPKKYADRPAGWHCTYYVDPKTSPLAIIEKMKVATTSEELDVLLDQLRNLPKDKSGFHCNGLKNPDNKMFFDMKAPEMSKAQCMPLRTFESYIEYLNKKCGG